jgi:tetratricopeptide (TPR) repeat protein
MVRLETGAFEDASQLFLRALALHPEDAQALLGRGEATLALGQEEQARAAFRAAVEAAAGDREVLAAAYRGLGISYRRARDLDKAIRELRKAVAEDPRDALARAQLGDALLAHPDVSLEEARRHLDRATRAEEPPALAWLALGQLALFDGDARSAKAAYGKAAERASARGSRDERVQAFLGLGDAALALGEPTAAFEQFLRALELAPERADIHARAGDARRLARDYEPALECYRRALAYGAGSDVLERALAVALEGEQIGAAAELAAKLSAQQPGNPHALVAAALSRIDAGALDDADAMLAAALRAGDDPEVHLALGKLALAAESGPEGGGRAAVEALAALRVKPSCRRARSLLATARARQFSVAAPAAGREHPVELATALARTCLTRPELSALAGEAQQAVNDFDQPLQVTVMGEFSSGKSSFVNAFIGEEVAPTGITPTTATINVVKYGRTRAGRIRYRDGGTREVRWEDLFAELSALSAAAARDVSLVEILLPLDDLMRVNIVDTPGLNSILPEHEEVARAFIARSDAIIWLFSAGQAGKASERDALRAFEREGKRVLGVLNKIDQLSQQEIEEATAHVAGKLGALVEVVVPLSARRALEHRASGEGDDGNFAALGSALEQRFFQRARELKQEGVHRRLVELLRRARIQVGQRRAAAQEAANGLTAAAALAAQARQEYTRKLVPEERRRLVEGAAELCRRAAREVLELVQPRRLPFGSHSATPADRDYLISVLETGFEALLEPSRRRVVQALRQASRESSSGVGEAAELVGVDLAFDVRITIDDAVELVEASVFDRCQAYLRGYVRGGYVDAFFRRDLPKLELSEDAVYHALYRDAPDIDGELRGPLAAAGASALGRITDRLTHFAAVAEVLAYDIEVGVERALAEVEARL